MNDQLVLKGLRVVAFMEGVSFLLLGITTPLKYMHEILWPNKIVGMAHGVLFILYIILVLLVASKMNWSKMNIFWSLLASVLPFGTFVVDVKIFKKYQVKTS